jgi:hypothetical protein
MRFPVVLLFAAFSLFAADTLHILNFNWSVPDAADWKVERQSGTPVLDLLTGKEPPASGPRRPMQFAIAETPSFTQATVEADVKPLGRSIMIVFAYQDAAHFDYAHLSIDTATKQPHHNGIFHVYGGERVRISSIAGPSAFQQNGQWYRVVLHYNGTTGTVDVQVDGTSVPALHAVDLSLASGRVGLGSFDETGEFKNVKISGTPAS